MHRRPSLLVHFIAVMLGLFAAVMLRDWPQPARWAVRLTPDHTGQSRMIVGVNEETDDLVLAGKVHRRQQANPSTPQGTIAQPARDPVLDTELTVFSLSTGRQRQQFNIPGNAPQFQVAIASSYLTCHALTENLLARIDRGNGHIDFPESDEQRAFVGISRTGKYLLRRSYGIEFLDLDQPDQRWQDLGKTSIKLLSWSPSGEFIVYKERHSPIIHVAKLGTHQDTAIVLPKLDSFEDFVLSIKTQWVKPNLGLITIVRVKHVPVTFKPGSAPLAAMRAENHVDHLLIDLTKSPTLLRKADESEARELAKQNNPNEQYRHLFADGSSVALVTKPASKLTTKLHELLSNYQFGWITASAIRGQECLLRFEHADDAEPAFTRILLRKEAGFANRLASVAQSQVDQFASNGCTVCFTPYMFLQPSYLGYFDGDRLVIYGLKPWMPTWLFQLLLFVSVYVALLLLSIVWNWMRSKGLFRGKVKHHA